MRTINLQKIQYTGFCARYDVTACVRTHLAQFERDHA